MAYINSETEFNSNVAVINRLNRLIDYINAARVNEDVPLLVRFIVALYKEVCVEMTDKEMEVEGELLKIISSLGSYGNNENSNLGKGSALFKLDAVDVKLRRIAKKHGLLSANKADPRKALAQR